MHLKLGRAWPLKVQRLHYSARVRGRYVRERKSAERASILYFLGPSRFARSIIRSIPSSLSTSCRGFSRSEQLMFLPLDLALLYQSRGESRMPVYPVSTFRGDGLQTAIGSSH